MCSPFLCSSEKGSINEFTLLLKLSFRALNSMPLSIVSIETTPQLKALFFILRPFSTQYFAECFAMSSSFISV